MRMDGRRHEAPASYGPSGLQGGPWWRRFERHVGDSVAKGRVSG